MSDIDKPVHGSPNLGDGLADEVANALASFTDDLLDGNVAPEQAENSFSENEELRQLQALALRMHRAFGSEGPDPAVSGRMKLNLVTELRKMDLRDEGKPASIGARIRALLPGSGRGRGLNALLPVAAIAAVFLFAFVFAFSDIELDNILGSSLGGYPIPERMEEITPLSGLNLRVSLNSDGGEVDNDSWYSAISADGRYVAFVSASDNLVANDTNGMRDVFVHDRNSGETERISLGVNGEEGNGDSLNPRISADGRFVVFESQASNLVSGDGNNGRDIFVRDRQFGTTELISIVNGQTANGDSRHPSISADGRFVVFYSLATNLTASDGNGVGDVFLYDRQNGMMTAVSLTSGGQTGNGESRNPAVSGDGQLVAFESLATNLAADDNNNASDIFLFSLQSGALERVSVNAANVEGDGPSYEPDLSADGGFVVFQSQAENLGEGDSNGKSDIFVYSQDGANQVQIERVNLSADGGGQANGDSGSPAISADGRFVAFSSYANNLAGGEIYGNYLDIYLHDRQLDSIERISADALGQEPEGASVNPDVSADGRFVSFDSTAPNLVGDDTNGRVDVFMRDRTPPVEVSINYRDGAPGSYFTVSGSRFSANSVVSLTVNGFDLGTVTSDTGGNFTILLVTAEADPGGYVLYAAGETVGGSISFMLDMDSVERPQETEATSFNVPPGIAYTHFNFLPGMIGN